MLPLPVASMDVGPVAEWIRTEKKRQRIHLPDTFQTTAPDDTYVSMPIGGAPKPVHHLQHEPPEPHPEVGETAPSQECQDLDVMERRIAESITASPDMSSADARVRHIATIVAQATARANVHVSRFEVTWLKVSKTYADFHELLVDSGVGGTVERVVVFWNMWRKLRYEVRQIEISFAVAKDAMSILRERTRQFEELCATHKECLTTRSNTCFEGRRCAAHPTAGPRSAAGTHARFGTAEARRQRRRHAGPVRTGGRRDDIEWPHGVVF